MGKGKGSGQGFSDNCVMFSVLILNILCGLFGALLFSLSIWLRSEREVKDWVRELQMYQYWNGLYILMAAGAIIVIISFFGCCGALMSNPCLLGTSSILVLIAIILELAGGIYILINGTETSKLQPWLERKFITLIHDSNYNDDAYRLMSKVQEKVGCCGSLNYQDYDRYRLPISDYCRDKITGNVYSEGCVRRFSIFIEKRAGWIAGIALFIGFMQLVLVGFTFCHWRNVREEPQEDRGRRKYDSVPMHIN